MRCRNGRRPGREPILSIGSPSLERLEDLGTTRLNDTHPLSPPPPPRVFVRFLHPSTNFIPTFLTQLPHTTFVSKKHQTKPPLLPSRFKRRAPPSPLQARSRTGLVRWRFTPAVTAARLSHPPPPAAPVFFSPHISLVPLEAPHDPWSAACHTCSWVLGCGFCGAFSGDLSLSNTFTPFSCIFTRRLPPPVLANASLSVVCALTFPTW
jgi:hypothetical protein